MTQTNPTTPTSTAQPTAATPIPALIPGIEEVSGTEGLVPQFLVIAAEKTGKSATVGTTLVNYPNPGMHPLFFAFDETGPVSCLKLGYRPHRISVKRMPGEGTMAKTREALSRIENNLPRIRQQYGSIIVDCASTMLDMFHTQAMKGKNPDPRSHFGTALGWAREVQNRLTDIGLPIWWLSWLREPETVEEKGANDVKIHRMIQGGANILGNFKAMLAGKVQHIFILEKQNVGVGRPGADEAGFVRVFHTRDHGNIRAGGRFQHMLPATIPAQCGDILRHLIGPR